MSQTVLQKLRYRVRDAIRRPHRAVIEVLVISRVPEFFDRILAIFPTPVEQFTRRHTMNLLLSMKYKRELVPAEKLTQKYDEALRILEERAQPGEPLGDYLEFGVYQGTSLSCFHEALQSRPASTTRLFGFDSFDGLPPLASDDDDGVWLPGQFKSSYEYTRAYLTKKGVDWNRTFLIKGWFNDTLGDALVEEYNIERASVVMVDCDIYSSAKQALEFSVRFIKGNAIIFFDDWHYNELDKQNMGEKRAFDEILQEHPQLHAQPLDDLIYHQNARVFLVSTSPT